MKFSEQVPSNEWAAVLFKGAKIAETWFKPQGEPFTLLFRIPQTSFLDLDLSRRLTLENLLKAAAVSAEEIESWHLESEGLSSTEESQTDLKHPLPPPPQDAIALNIRIRLKPPVQAVVPSDLDEQVVPPEKWQALEARWRTVQGVEASIDSLRQRLESLRAELEAEFKKSLAADEKVHALNADLAQWNKAKNRAHYAVPKAREFIHRATWALGVPERKRLEELFKNYIELQIPFPEMDKVPEQIESLLKDRQVLAAHGTAVYQECKSVSAEIQRTLRTLQSNAAERGRKKRGEKR